MGFGILGIRKGVLKTLKGLESMINSLKEGLAPCNGCSADEGTERQQLQVSDAKEMLIPVQDEGILSGGLGPVASFFFYSSKLLPSVISLWPEGFPLAFSLIILYYQPFLISVLLTMALFYC